MGILITCIGQKHAIIVGLALEACQLALLGFFSAPWILWTAGSIAGLGSITYPALSAFLSNHVKSDQQGLTQVRTIPSSSIYYNTLFVYLYRYYSDNQI